MISLIRTPTWDPWKHYKSIAAFPLHHPLFSGPIFTMALESRLKQVFSLTDAAGAREAYDDWAEDYDRDMLDEIGRAHV